MSNGHKKVSYKGQYYAIMEVEHKDSIRPILLDYKDYKYIKDLNKNWKCNKNNFISCTHTYNDNTKEIFIHDIIMALKHKDDGTERENYPIIHINNNGFDNRRENLIYDNNDKDCNKNYKKKKRTIDMPKGSGITPEEIPTYIWYLKPNGSHGERFIVQIGDIKWKTTSSKNKSLRYKLEEAKKYLRDMKKSNPDIFDEYCMNGEYTKKGKELLDGYYKIVTKNGYDVDKYKMDGLTDKYLSPMTNKIKSKKERKLLESE